MSDAGRGRTCTSAVVAREGPPIECALRAGHDGRHLSKWGTYWHEDDFDLVPDDASSQTPDPS